MDQTLQILQALAAVAVDRELALRVQAVYPVDQVAVTGETKVVRELVHQVKAMMVVMEPPIQAAAAAVLVRLVTQMVRATVAMVCRVRSQAPLLSTLAAAAAQMIEVVFQVSPAVKEEAVVALIKTPVMALRVQMGLAAVAAAELGLVKMAVLAL
jgi:hypothetical protein